MLNSCKAINKTLSNGKQVLAYYMHINCISFASIHLHTILIVNL